MTTHAMPQTKLLKSRIKVTRIFAAAILVMLIFGAPILPIKGIAQWIGYFGLIIAVIGRMLCTMYVGGRKNEALVADGPYSIVRNPLYVFSFCGVVGLGLISGMVTVLAILTLAFVFYYPHVVRREEGFLAERFGDAYRDYCARTPAWIPNLKLWHSPDSINVNPKFVLITLRDAAAFFLAFPILALIEYAQGAGWMPVLFSLY